MPSVLITGGTRGIGAAIGITGVGDGSESGPPPKLLTARTWKVYATFGVRPLMIRLVAVRETPSLLGEIDAQNFSSPGHDRPPYACGWLPTLFAHSFMRSSPVQSAST